MWKQASEKSQFQWKNAFLEKFCSKKGLISSFFHTMPALPVMSTPATAPPQHALNYDQNHRRNLPATNSAGTIVSSTNSQTPLAQKFQQYQNRTSNSNLNRNNNNNNKMVDQSQQRHNNQSQQNRNNQVYNNHFSQNPRYPSSTSSETQRLHIFSCGGLIFLWHLVYSAFKREIWY